MRISVPLFRPTHPVMVALLFVMLGAGVAPAADQPIQIQADKMTAREKSQIVIFTGNVDASQGDVQIHADKMTIFYSNNGKKDEETGKYARQVKKITCNGNVEVTSTDWLGTSDTMHYFARKNLVQLIGNATAYQGQNMIQGTRIDHNLETGESVVHGSEVEVTEEQQEEEQSGRVNMTILEQ